MSILRISLLAFALAAAGCAAKLPTVQFEKSRTVNASLDDAWARATLYFEGNQFPVQSADKAASRIVAKRDRVGWSDMSVLAACHDQPLLINPRTGEITLNVLFESSGVAQTRVTVDVGFRMTYFDATSAYVTYDCNSKGELERALLNAIAR